MSETNNRICKHCRVIKLRIQDGNFPNAKDKRWVDEHGQQWNGSTCPSCATEKARLRMGKRRNEKV